MDSGPPLAYSGYALFTLADSDAGSQFVHRPAGWSVPPRSRASPIMFKLWVIQTFLFLLILLDQAMAQTLGNITVDDNDPAILYVGNWDPDAQHPSQFDYGGSHTLSGDATASATFTFTGVAVYYLAPKWAYNVDSYVALDGGAPALVDMTGPAESADEDVQWAPLWSATGLSNDPHSVSVTRGPSGYAVVDGFIYTAQGAGAATTSQFVSIVVSTTTVGTNQEASSTISGASASSTSSSGPNSTVIIAVTISASVVCLILVIILIIFCMRRKRKTDVARRNSTASGEVTYIYAPGQETNTHSASYSAMAYSNPTTTGSASGAGPLSSQQQMNYANVLPYGQDAYRPSSMSNQALVFPSMGATYNTGGSGNGYNAQASVAGGGYYGGNSSGHNIAAAYAGVGSSAAIAPPNRPPSFLSESAGPEGSYTLHAGGPNTADAGYSGYAAGTSGVAAATTSSLQELQRPPVPEKARYNPARASGSKNAQPYNAAGPISAPEPPPSYAHGPEASGSRPSPSSPPRPNEQGFI